MTMTDKPTRCELKTSPDCEQVAEVKMRAGAVNAVTCVPCGKAFQSRYSHMVGDLTIWPLNNTDGDTP